MGKKEGRKKDDGDGFIYWTCMGWDGRTDDDGMG
jgi:hypothetical protein